MSRVSSSSKELPSTRPPALSAMTPVVGKYSEPSAVSFKLKRFVVVQCKRSILSSNKALVRSRKKRRFKEETNESKSARITSFFWRYLRKNKEILW